MRILNLFITITLAFDLLLLQRALLVAATLTIHHVAPNANCSTARPCYATLQAAIDAAHQGSEK